MYRILDTIFTSRTRILLLLTFFSNVRNTGFLRGFAEEFGESTNSVRTELLRLADAGLILSCDNGRRRYYRANPRHPLYPELRNITHKTLGLDGIRQLLATRADVQLVLVIGAYARGRDSGTVELMIVGRDKHPDVDGVIAQAEEAAGRNIRPFLFSEKQFLELRRSLRLDDVLVLREDEGAAGKLLEGYRDPRWAGDPQWKSDIRWDMDTCKDTESPLDGVADPGRPGDAAQPGHPEDSAISDAPESAAQPGHPEDSATSDAPESAAQPDDPEDAAISDAPESAAQPDDSEDAATSVGAAYEPREVSGR